MSALFHGIAHSASSLDVRAWTVPRRRVLGATMDATPCAAWRTMLVLVLVFAPAVAGSVLLLLVCCCTVGDVVGRFCARAGAGDCCAEEVVPCAGSTVLAGGGRWRLLVAGDTGTGAGIDAANGPVALVGVTDVECGGAGASGICSVRGGYRTAVSCVAG